VFMKPILIVICCIWFVFSEANVGDFSEDIDVHPQDGSSSIDIEKPQGFLPLWRKHQSGSDGSERHGKKHPLPVQSGNCYITSTTVNMRSSACGPSIIAQIPQGAIVSSNGGTTNLGSCSLGNFLSWQPVSYNGRTGYVAAAYVSSTSCSGGGGGGGSGTGSVTRNSVYNSLSSGAKSALASIASTCKTTVTPMSGSGGHCDFSISGDYSSCFQSARTQGYLSAFEFIWHPGASHCSTRQHMHILEGYRSHGIDRLYPAGSNDRQDRKPSASTWNSCQWLNTINNGFNWCCYRWY